VYAYAEVVEAVKVHSWLRDAGLAKGILWWRTGGFVWSRLYFGRLPIEEILSRMRMNEAWGLHQTL
jgi:hypothetical protein